MSEVFTVEAAAAVVRKPEVFENETTIFFTHEVDTAYEPIVLAMARAIYQHDTNREHEFPTGNVEVDDPYLCRADDALREAIPLFREKIAGELREAFPGEAK